MKKGKETMKVLKVIHGYPPYYMAGSEVYTYNLTRELSKHMDVSVFTRVENPFERSYTIFDEVVGRVKVRRVNKPARDYTMEDKYLDPKMDDRFREYAGEVEPDVVHIGHLSHLSTGIVNIAKEEFGLPVIYTIHDFWLFCFRGQAIKPEFEICPAPSPEGCLECAREKFKDKVTRADMDRYGEHMKRVRDNVDVYLSPSMFLENYFEENGIPGEKIRYSRYGFKTDEITFGRNRIYDKDSEINFGFMGRIIPTKGIHVLLRAFGELCAKNGKNTKNRNTRKNSRLLIFGDAGPLRKYLNGYTNENIIFRGGYKNREIDTILDKIDVLVVPSIWYENSPLVIQEAFLAGIPVITSNLGGMKELVKDGVNGLTFEVGNVDDLAEKMEKIVVDPTILNDLKPERESMRSIEDDAAGIMAVYREALNK